MGRTAIFDGQVSWPPEPPQPSTGKITIDERRRMVIPHGMILGVTSDGDAARIVFRFARRSGDEDLSEYSARVNIINAGGEEDIYTVTDLAVAADDEDFCECSWIVSRRTADYAGDVQFSLCLRDIDPETAEVKHEWNSQPAKMTVKQGLEVDGDIIEHELSDWATALIIEVTELKDGAAESAGAAAESARAAALSESAAEQSADDAAAALREIDGKKAEAIRAIEEKGAETLQSIPEDYTALSNQVQGMKIYFDRDNGRIVLDGFTGGDEIATE